MHKRRIGPIISANQMPCPKLHTHRRNHPPTAPTISGPTTGTVSTSMTFGAVSTDPDNDQIRYGFDWNKDGTVDEWDPSSGYVNSGTSQNGSKSWSTTGAQSFQVLAQDSKGATSTWSSYNVTVNYPTLTTATCTPTPSTITTGGSVSWTTTAAGGTGSYTYAWTGTDSLSATTQTTSKTYSTTGTKSATVTVTSGSQTASSTCSAVVNPQSTCANGAVNYPNCTIDNSGNCLNGDTNPPTCTTPPSCANGAVNYPTCTIGSGGQCLNGNTNPPTCTNTPTCSNGATNYPTCSTCPTNQCLISSTCTIGSGSVCFANNLVNTCGTLISACPNGCSTVGGVGTCNVYVPPVNLTLTINPTTVHTTATSTLTWNVTGAISCSINGPGLINYPVSLSGGAGSGQKSIKVTSSSNYVLSCSNGVKTYTATAICAVTPIIIEN